MKTQHLMAMCLLAASTLFGQQGIVASQIHNKQPTASDADTKYSVVHRDANSRVWRRTTYEAIASGTMVPHVHQYTELATGMNYKDPQTGQWQESSETIELVAGGAVARHGQHKVTFAADLATFGAIDVETPDGQRLQSHLLGLAYFDRSSGKSVFIAQVTNSIGQLVSSNQVWYDNAFTGVKAGVRYTYTRAGFEQDVILEERPPAPEAYGFDPSNTVLQAFTEFISPPAPSISLSSVAPGELPDVALCFGGMKIGRGRAFLMENNSNSFSVSKEWTSVDGRHLLIEEVPMRQIAHELQTLPRSQSALTKFPNSVVNVVSNKRMLPSQPLARLGTNEINIASLRPKELGFVLDYILLNTSQTNYVFAGDTTYFITGIVNISGAATLQGGTVIKYGINLLADIRAGSIICQTAPYRPAIFTAEDDNSVGETIPGSIGIPQGYYGVTNLDVEDTNDYTLKNLKFAYANQAIRLGNPYVGNTVTLQNCQFLDSYIPITAIGIHIKIYNSLFSGIESLALFDDITMDVEQCTVDRCGILGSWISDGGGDPQNFTNCLLVVTNGGDGQIVLDHSPNFLVDPGLFQTVGAGKYYLATNSSYRNAGTTNINPDLLAELQLKTTYPPIIRSNIVFSSNTTFSPQAQRDADLPDIGYHYDPIDYLLNADIISNATLTVSSGTVIGAFTTAGFEALRLEPNSKIICTGAANNRNYIVFYNTVQEQTTNGWSDGTQILDSDEGSVYSSGSFGSGLFTFTTWSSLGGKTFIWDETLNRGPVVFNHCEFDTGKIFNYSLDMAITNCLFVEDYVMQNQDDESVPFNLTMDNCSLLDGNLVLFYDGVFVGGGSFILQNNFFEETAIDDESLSAYSTANNGYVTGYDRLSPHLLSDTILTTSPVYQTGPLGLYYLPTGNALINAGSTTADLFGLYHFTTTKNQVKETNSVVDLGYHYVAVDVNGNPMDTDGDGLPDYVEDVNGDGIYGTGDLSNWLLFSTDGTGMSDGWEIKYFGSLGNNPAADPDGDGLTNLQESQFGLNPLVDDSTQSASRLNYIYDSDGWLNQVSGARNGSVTTDDQGNVQQTSQ